MLVSIQYGQQELEMDTAHIFDLIQSDPKYENHVENLNHEKAEVGIMALNFLHSDWPPKKDGWMSYLTLHGCMIVSVLQQLLVMLLTKRLMNLMTAEAVILYHQKIPHFYLKNYLSFQIHFSLKDSIANYHRLLMETLK